MEIEEAAMFPTRIGVPELLIIMVILVLVFGAGRLSDIGGAMGKSIREFRRSVKDDETPDTSETPADSKSQ